MHELYRRQAHWCCPGHCQCMQHCEGSSAALSHVHLVLLPAAGAAVSAQCSVHIHCSGHSS
eukprot:13454-Heterococcus_DN1.PRE.4